MSKRGKKLKQMQRQKYNEKMKSLINLKRVRVDFELWPVDFAHLQAILPVNPDDVLAI